MPAVALRLVPALVADVEPEYGDPAGADDPVEAGENPGGISSSGMWTMEWKASTPPTEESGRSRPVMELAPADLADALVAATFTGIRA